MEKTYQLVRRNGDGTESMIAEAEGSTFWTELYHFAVKLYGGKSVYYTFGDRGRKHVARPVMEDDEKEMNE